ncbi:DNA-binding IclR family transcriptional regulator [Planomonospora venezuelensis]|uniref:DNA-binding IclR family transcriptional regulator n=1 Tax=Planomonospora venezuelensis TaxID=1999 RepID=A0A841D693_PLAVE|nr:DNA-binding IclR family transcriptional regulator [Planomonospora venezuelensis]
MTRNPDRLSMLEKSWLVLDAFRPTGGPLRLADVAERCHLPKTTAFRLLAELTGIGAVTRREDGYYLGRRLFELGSIVPLERDLRHAALPFMHDLYEATHETVHLGVRDGLDVVYVEKIQGREAFALPSRVGGRLPLTCTGIGKALLAHSGPDLIEEVLGRPLRRLTPHSIVDPRRMEEAIGQIQAAGLAYEREEAQPGGACIAAPVFHEGAAVAALSVSVPLPRFHPIRLAPAVKAAALGISRALTRTIQ